MSTIALNNQNVYVNNKAEKKVEKKMYGQKSEHLLWKMQMH